jgi:type IV pilus assembly protein PilA
MDFKNYVSKPLSTPPETASTVHLKGCNGAIQTTFCDILVQGDVMRNKQRGFSLIELLIVVAIILIIAAIAIPNLLRSKMAANEASAVGSLRTINTASVGYSTTYGGYPPALTNLSPATPATATSADLIDSVLATGTKSGYAFTYAAVTSDANGNILSYTLNANPLKVGTTGQRGFFTNQTGVIRADPTTAATATSTPIS